MSDLGKIRAGISFLRIGKWTEFLVMLCIGMIISLAVFKIDYKIGLLIAVSCVGLIGLLLCFYRIEIGIYGLIILGFLAAFIDRLFFPVAVPTTTVLLFLPFVLLVVMMLKIIYNRNKKWFIGHPIIFIYLITVGYAIVQAFNPRMDSIPGWLSFFRGILISLIMLLLFLYIFKDLKSIRFFFKIIIGLFFVTGLYGCIQQKFGLTSFEYRWLLDRPGALGLFSLPGEGIRKFSFLTDPANFGTLMATAAAGTIIMLAGPYKKTEKIILGIFTLIIVLGMSYSGTRTAYVTIFAGIALYILMTIGRKRTLIIASAVAVALLLILYMPIYSNITINRIRTAFRPPSNDASYDIRSIHRHEMQPFMHSHPFGNGVNTTMGAGTKYNPHNPLAGFPPDSTYFYIALEQGWVGLALNCLFFFSLLFYAVRYFYQCRNKEIKNYYAMLTGMLFIMLLGAYTQFTITSIPQNFVFIAFIACIIKLHTFDTPELSKSNTLKPYQ